MKREEAIAAHLKAHDAKIAKRRKAREAVAERKKKRGLRAFIDGLKTK